MTQSVRAMNAPRIISGIHEIADSVDALLIDLWGVIHNGVDPYDGVIDCLRELKKRNKKTCFLSNAPRRSYTVVQKLTDMGVTPDLYTAILTSGDATHHALLHRHENDLSILGDKCYFSFAREGDKSLAEEQNFDVVTDPAEASFVLCSGVRDFAHGLDVYEDELVACAKLKLPMVCANPDLTVMIGNQGDIICAGTLAKRYEELGGRVFYFGKPHKGVYEQAHKILGHLPKDRMAGIGDSPRTDIAGAMGFGIQSVLIAGGLHAQELFDFTHKNVSILESERFFTKNHQKPDLIAPYFTW